MTSKLWKLWSLSFLTVMAVAGCSSSGGTEPQASGGHQGTSSGGHTGTSSEGGASGTGGITGKGGSTGSGGSVSSGGSIGSGGSMASGGSIGSGGIVASGGTSAGSGSGGSTGSATGGSTGQGAGGASQTGGTATAGSGAGGASTKGGSTGTGAGGTMSGGATGSGGRSGAGGATSKGGASGGGTSGGTTGGSTGTAGSGGGGGGNGGGTGASDYPAAGSTGQAQPTGTGSKVTVLDWAGFKSAVSFTFDDTNQSQIDHYQELEAEKVRYTFFLWTGKNEINSSTWTQAVKDGHQLDNHTKSHQSAASTSDIQAAEDTIKQMFSVTSYDVAAPNGDASYQTVVPSMKKFLTNRTAGNSGGISPTDDPSTKQYALPCIIPATGASASTMENSISSTISGGKWVTFLVHGFTGGTDSAYQPVDIAQFTATVTWAKTQGNIWIDSVENIASYWIAEYNFNKLTPTTSGTDKTWTWTTSNFSNPFPPGKFLRVKTDGGVLKQGSTVVPWDDHGYYEVSLDAGTLTLSSQ